MNPLYQVIHTRIKVDRINCCMFHVPEAGMPEFIVWLKGNRHLRLPPSWPADW